MLDLLTNVVPAVVLPLAFSVVCVLFAIRSVIHSARMVVQSFAKFLRSIEAMVSAMLSLAKKLVELLDWGKDKVVSFLSFVAQLGRARRSLK
jgi:hypothetical protein